HSSRRAAASAYAVTRAECPRVYGSRASIARLSLRREGTGLSVSPPALLSLQRVTPTLSLRVLDHAPLPDVEADDDRGADDGDGDAADQAELLDRIAGSVASVVRREADEGRPADPAGGVPEEEAPPRHLSDASQPGRGDAKE